MHTGYQTAALSWLFCRISTHRTTTPCVNRTERSAICLLPLPRFAYARETWRTFGCPIPRVPPVTANCLPLRLPTSGGLPFPFFSPAFSRLCSNLAVSCRRLHSYFMVLLPQFLLLLLFEHAGVLLYCRCRMTSSAVVRPAEKLPRTAVTMHAALD